MRLILDGMILGPGVIGRADIDRAPVPPTLRRDLAIPLEFAEPARDAIHPGSPLVGQFPAGHAMIPCHLDFLQHSHPGVVAFLRTREGFGAFLVPAVSRGTDVFVFSGYHDLKTFSKSSFFDFAKSSNPRFC